MVSPFSALTAVVVLVCASCGGSAQSPAAPVSGYRVLKTYPHDPGAFTQGLFYLDGFLYEGTGLNGQSSLRKVRIEDGEVLQQRALPPQYFGEGIAPWNGKILQLTWRSQVGFIYERETFEMTGRFEYSWEGWGLTPAGKELVMSDGTPTLHFLDGTTLKETRRVSVFEAGAPVRRLNELERIGGEIWANIWQTERIARIDPISGNVKGWIDLTGILPPQDRELGANEMNGIAYDHQTKRIFVTGKNWPKLFEIEVLQPAP